MTLLILALVLVVSIALIPIGLPGLWIMVASGWVYNFAVPGQRVGLTTLVFVTLLGVIAEVLEFTLAARFTTRYGGSRRAGWGAILGGFVGAIVGVPVPIIGSVIGGFVGAFVGAFIAEWSRRDTTSSPGRAATGAILGRAAGAAIKTAFGLAIAAWLLLAAWK